MPRELDEDFVALQSFVDRYSIATLNVGKEATALVRSGHKSYFVLLSLWSQALHACERNGLTLHGTTISVDGPELVYLKECVSDFAHGYFCCLHGAYKPAHMCLRSSIENFVRFVASPFDATVLATTSVFDLFELAKTTPPLSKDAALFFQVLRSLYSKLCKYTHSASLEHMGDVHALAHFPSIDQQQFGEWLASARKTIMAITSVLVRANPNLYVKSHFKVREVLDLALPTRLRMRVLRAGM